ncbi:uncharacterized protein PAC_12653 [Phialocephala subalpina]|uniref:Uncharacterized protein n=1 Tax=Phialocephala subalpina TaxID=576137 RepID=A0A1L7XCN3_9HELO|nr:uncharacterized protein PAC_12653 [Phialocephala subalpina]
MATQDSTTGRSILALSLVGAFGVNSMYGLAWRNGYISSLLRLRDHGPYTLPGSNVPILTCFTGIGILDKALTLAGVMFANVTDGSAPASSMYGFQFAGQLVPMFTIMLVEAVRRGNKGNVMSWAVLWGCASQGLGYGFTMPIYAIVHLLCSPTAVNRSPVMAQDVRLRSTKSVDTIIPSLVLGYVVPSVLMAIPISSPMLHQWLGGFWQGYPVWVTLIQYGIGFIRSRRSEKDDESKPSAPVESSRVGEEMVLHRAYLFAFAFSATTNILTYGILASVKLFPSLFSDHIRTALTFRNVFIPPPFWSREPMPNMAAGIQNFFQYDQYVGSTAAIVWATTLWIKARKQAMTLNNWLWLAGEIFGISIVAGPGAAWMSLIWNRDELILGDDELFLNVEGQSGDLIDTGGEAERDIDEEDLIRL